MRNKGSREDVADTSRRMELLGHMNGLLDRLLPQYIRAYAIFVTIMGAVLKFAFDDNSTEELRNVLGAFGLAFSAVGLITCVFGERVRRGIASDLRRLSVSLNLPAMESSFKPLKYTVIIATIFTVISLAGWIYLWCVRP